MKRSQQGFTLIELVMVIVILGVLAAVAVPKFVDLSGDARAAAVKGVAGALASGSSINYSTALARNQADGATWATATAKAGVTDPSGGCTTTVASGLAPTGVTFAATGSGAYNVSGGTAPTVVGGTTTCTVTSVDDTSRTASFVLIGAK